MWSFSPCSQSFLVMEAIHSAVDTLSCLVLCSGAPRQQWSGEERAPLIGSSLAVFLQRRAQLSSLIFTVAPYFFSFLESTRSSGHFPPFFLAVFFPPPLLLFQTCLDPYFFPVYFILRLSLRHRLHRNASAQLSVSVLLSLCTQSPAMATVVAHRGRAEEEEEERRLEERKRKRRGLPNTASSPRKIATGGRLWCPNR